MINQDLQKKNAAEKALAFIEHGMILGIGSGSTVNFFIEALQSVKNKIEAVIVSSNATAERIKKLSIPIIDLNSVGEVPLYIDGADEINAYNQMIKGGGGALTREKIIASASKKFICLVDSTKKVDLLGKHPVPVEVIPMARSFVARQLVKLGGDPVYRSGFVTDNGNVILDVFNLKILNPLELEKKIKEMVGVVENGIFAARTADVVIVG